ncbi:GIN domain-containing protein [Pseudoduganella namucuonensis]|uniref:Putative auto-transporter adhesin, head GIN domain n=1 Tax=Pseudoduganella namucuonensis TaxID=1035707 RepID=A0A1I7IMD6_9BURK|nr:DUF2807 domain-containing protein [Pseudoduganella namucuonensis]SFU74077.1 Putative auto-transporter adhesin, head GIN domain [Pseudoduganella namucuonensis]
MRRLLILAGFATFAACAHADEQVRTVAPFTAIDSKGPLSITVEGGKAQSVTVSGNEKFTSRLITEVVNGELKIYMKDKSMSNTGGDPRVVVTVPALVKFIGEGAGETVLRNMRGERLDVSYQGAGSFSASGKVKLLRLKAQGVGEVDTKELHAERADVNFNGLGAVKVTATDTLNAVVNGMGSLDYYGKPRHVNKTVNGIGSVNARE